MTDPKVSEEEMLDVLNSIVGAADGEGAVDERDEEVIQAIRAAISGYFRLREKVGEWSKKMEKYFVEGRISIPCRAIDWNKMTEFFKEIRDFGASEKIHGK